MDCATLGDQATRDKEVAVQVRCANPLAAVACQTRSV